MSLMIILIIGVMLSIGFHFIGVYTGSKKIIWVMLIAIWALAIGTAMNEIKPNGYLQIKKVQGQFTDTDQLIKEAGDEISTYEMIIIMHSYQINSPKK